MKRIATTKRGNNNSISRLLLIILCLHSSQFAYAQNSNERWFQVEVIAFKRQLQDQQEHWPTSINLGYPDNWVELKDPEDQTGAGESAINETDTADGSSLTSSDPVSNVASIAFGLLPDADQGLARHAATLRRDSRFEVLFHEAWRQPVTSRRNAPAIILRGGKDYGRHAELEGSITVSVAQLLQVDTNLWLTWFAPNEGQASEWPPLPNVPTAPTETPKEQAFTHYEDQTKTVDLAEQHVGYMTIQPVEQALLEETDPFVPVRIVQLKEERKLRSKELHYIDHPLLGLIIQITPYDPAAAAKP